MTRLSGRPLACALALSALFVAAPPAVAAEPPDTSITKGPFEFRGVTRTTAQFELASTAEQPVYECRLDGAAWEPCEATTRVYEGLAEGDHVVEARSAEGPGGVMDATPARRVWYIDSLGPTIENLSPADGATLYTQDGAVDFTWLITDAGSGVRWRNLVLRVDGRSYDRDNTFELMETGYRLIVAAGVHTWDLEVRDLFLNYSDPMTPRTFTMVIDQTPPEPITLLWPGEGARTTDATPTLTWEPASDTTSPIAAQYVVIDGVVYPAAPDAGSFTPPADLTDGRHTWYVGARDAAGNQQESATRTFTVRQMPVGVSIDGGDRFTNSPEVTLSVRAPAGATSVLVANDRGFTDAVSYPVGTEIPWTLDTSGKQRQKRVYVRFAGSDRIYHDAITLDRTAPRIASAAAVGRRVAVRASDSGSGLGTVEVTADRARAGKAHRWSRVIGVSSKPRWVRITDRAGNRSAWYRVARL